jgi:hypothetical protein
MHAITSVHLLEIAQQNNRRGAAVVNSKTFRPISRDWVSDRTKVSIG